MVTTLILLGHDNLHCLPTTTEKLFFSVLLNIKNHKSTIQYLWTNNSIQTHPADRSFQYSVHKNRLFLRTSFVSFGMSMTPLLSLSDICIRKKC